MTKLVLENTDLLNAKEIRIYRVKSDGSMDPLDSELEVFGGEQEVGGISCLGINLNKAYDVSCVGASSFAGEVEITLAPEATIVRKNVDYPVPTENSLIGVLTEQLGLKVTEITPYQVT